MFLEGIAVDIVPMPMVEGLSPVLQLVYAWVCHYVLAEKEPFPSHEAITKSSGLDKKIVIRSLVELQKREYILRGEKETEDPDVFQPSYSIPLYSKDELQTLRDKHKRNGSDDL